MAKKKFYAVKKGRKPGVYLTWDDTKKQVDGYSAAQYKSFSTRPEAEDWIANGEKKASSTTTAPQPVTSNASELVLYTDGGSRNTGNVKGGHVRQADLAAWAFLIQKGSKQHSGSGGERGATNNRMEIMALINGLQTISEQYGDQQPVLVVSDSKYVLDAINQNWIWGWKKRGWKKADGNVVANQELWQKVAVLLTRMKHLEFKWTKGHATNAGNVFVDQLLNQTMDEMGQAPEVPSKKEVKMNTKPVEKKLSTKTDAPDLATEASVEDLMASFKQLGLFNHQNQD